MIDPLLFVKELLENNWDTDKYGPKPQIITLQKFVSQVNDVGIVYLHSVRASVEPLGVGIQGYNNSYIIIIDIWTASRTRLSTIVQGIIEILFTKTKELNNPYKLVVEGYEDFSGEVFGAQRGQLTVRIEEYTAI